MHRQTYNWQTGKPFTSTRFEFKILHKHKHLTMIFCIDFDAYCSDSFDTRLVYLQVFPPFSVDFYHFSLLSHPSRPSHLFHLCHPDYRRLGFSIVTKPNILEIIKFGQINNFDELLLLHHYTTRHTMPAQMMRRTFFLYFHFIAMCSVYTLCTKEPHAAVLIFSSFFFCFFWLHEELLMFDGAHRALTKHTHTHTIPTFAGTIQ